MAPQLQLTPASYETQFRVPNQIEGAQRLGDATGLPAGLFAGLQLGSEGVSGGIPFALMNFISQYPYLTQQFPQTAASAQKSLPDNFAQYAPYGAAGANFLSAYALQKAGQTSAAGSSALRGSAQLAQAQGYDKTAGYLNTGADGLGVFGAIGRAREGDLAGAIGQGLPSATNLITSAGYKLGTNTMAGATAIGGAANIVSGIGNFKNDKILAGTQILQGGTQLYDSAKTLGLIGQGGQAAVAGTQAASAGAIATGNAVGAGAGLGETILGGLETAGTFLGPAIAAYGVGKTLFGDADPKTKAREAKQGVEDGVAAYFTAGLSSLAQFGDEKLLGGAGAKLRDKVDGPDIATGVAAYGVGKATDVVFGEGAAGKYNVKDLTMMALNPGGYLLQKGLEKGLAMTGSKKGEDQLSRDSYRKFAKENKILDDKFQGKLADGSAFDFGADGSKLKYGDVAKETGAGDAIAIGDALVAGLGLKGKQRESLTLLFSKAALSNSKGSSDTVIANMRNLAKQHGLDGKGLQASLDKQHKAGEISDNEYLVWSSKGKDVFGGPGASNPIKDNTSKEATEKNMVEGAKRLGLSEQQVQSAMGTNQPTVVGPDGKPVKPPIYTSNAPPGKYYTPDGKLATGIDPGFTQGNVFVPDGQTFESVRRNPNISGQDSSGRPISTKIGIGRSSQSVTNAALNLRRK